MMVRAALMLCVGLLVASCGDRDTGPITMGVIGSSLKMSDPSMGAVPQSAELLLAATAQGLVSFDATDQVQPALAERWIVTDDGLSYIFRIREATWADGTAVASADVARSLKRSMAANGRNPLRRLFSNVTAVIPMTGQVVEIRLRSPEPNFLQILAQPELAILRSGGGTGPFLIHSRRGGILRLRVKPGPEEEESEAPATSEDYDVRLRAEHAALGIARFKAGGSAYLTGGSFVDLPLVSAARSDSSRFKIDPAYGLFGLIVAEKSVILADPDLRLALSLAIDRDRLVQQFRVPSWKTSIAVLPAALDSAGPPSALSALQRPIAERRNRAQALVKSSGIKNPQIRVAIPEGPGGRVLFAVLVADWKRIGVKAERAATGQPADLILIDEVAPVSSALWYLTRLSCGAGAQCSRSAQDALSAVLGQADLNQKRALLSQADAALVSTNVYIPIALPLRWSLVGTGLTGWRPSAFSAHTLDQLH